MPEAQWLEQRRLLSTSVLQYHNDLVSDGVNSTEYQLTPSTVNASQFQKQFTTPVDGQVYAQPLYVPGVDITTGNQQGVHDVVYVATENDSLYAIDSNGGNVLWMTSFLDTNNSSVNLIGASTIEPVSGGAAVDTRTNDLTPDVGITSTPVIDAGNGVIYLVAKSKQIVGSDTGDPHFVQTLFEVDISSGTIVNSTLIGNTIYDGSNYTYSLSDPYVVGTGAGSITVNGQHRIYFNGLREFNREALILYNGQVYIGFASHGDNGPYHGWLLRYDASTLALTGALNTTPNGSEGGIWMAGGAPVVDDQGNIYLMTGNGTFDGEPLQDGSGNTIGTTDLDANGFPINGDYGDCYLKITDDPTSTEGDQEG
ncbi:MAG TPA: hypothetical protein VG722_08215, partial [Tepidisphaeraceae bacterium]|nr:hypothetical protein [Tepidisphaeraceae bacterium]